MCSHRIHSHAIKREGKVLVRISSLEVDLSIHRRFIINIIPFLEIGGVDELFGGSGILCPCTPHPSHHQEKNEGMEEVAG